MRCPCCGAWAMAVFDFYGWSYICECGYRVHIDIQTESRSLDDPGENAIQSASAEREEDSKAQATH